MASARLAAALPGRALRRAPGARGPTAGARAGAPWPRLAPQGGGGSGSGAAWPRRSYVTTGLKDMEEDATPLQVKYWVEGKPAVPLDSIKVDLSKYNTEKIFSVYGGEDGATLLPDMDLAETQRLRAHMEDVFSRIGVVHLVNTGFTSTSQFNAATKVLMPNHMDYTGGANRRAPIEANVYDTGAPREADLQYHHEMAYVSTSCQWVAFGAIEATHNPIKGATFISENIGATNMLLCTTFGRKLVDKGMCYVRKLPDEKYFVDNDRDPSIVYNFWQTSTGCTDMWEAQEVMERKGLEVEWQNSAVFGRYMVTKYYVDTFEYDPFNDRNTLFASVADDYAWFDSWPGVQKLPHWERPLKLTFGDGEVINREQKQLWVDCYDTHGLPILWSKGDLAIICNYRTAHGRPRRRSLAGTGASWA
ncbi:unnamed protein product [Prorocentrum cordatum]|uniref:TauD/TfdA-like domain-containing protein n=1 Tax=Prorocentrum cordatum TaxID=2364126 RepID=A0ABN9VDL2_9DINO|nr:unnamed protein product [Polarella glacialis]